MTTEKTEKKPETRTVHPVDPAKVKDGDLMAFTYYGTVKTISKLMEGGHKLWVEGVAGGPDSFGVNGDKLIGASTSADQYHEEQKITKTAAAELLVSAYNRPFTVCFVKQEGEERVLRGRLVQPEPLLGRSHVEDLDITEGHRLRLVDHRTIKWLVLEGVRYLVKS